jgi:hypothetical protein
LLRSTAIRCVFLLSISVLRCEIAIILSIFERGASVLAHFIASAALSGLHWKQTREADPYCEFDQLAESERTVNKMNLAGTSLVAALPASFLVYVMLMAVMNSMDVMPTMMKVAAIMLLTVAVVMVIFPLWVLVYYKGETSEAADASQPATDTSSVPSESDADDQEGAFDEEAINDSESGEVDDFDLDDDEDFDDGGDEFEFDDDEEEF